MGLYKRSLMDQIGCAGKGAGQEQWTGVTAMCKSCRVGWGWYRLGRVWGCVLKRYRMGQGRHTGAGQEGYMYGVCKKYCMDWGRHEGRATWVGEVETQVEEVCNGWLGPWWVHGCSSFLFLPFFPFLPSQEAGKWMLLDGGVRDCEIGWETAMEHWQWSSHDHSNSTAAASNTEAATTFPDFNPPVLLFRYIL